jgi:hypothetical protein
LSAPRVGSAISHSKDTGITPGPDPRPHDPTPTPRDYPHGVLTPGLADLCTLKALDYVGAASKPAPAPPPPPPAEYTPWLPLLAGGGGGGPGPGGGAGPGGEQADG